MALQWTEETINCLLRWREEGLTQLEIAERLGISKNAVNCKMIRLREAGLLPEKPKGNKPQKAQTGAEKPVKLAESQGNGEDAAFAKLLDAVCVLVNLTGKLVERYDKGYPNE